MKKQNRNFLLGIILVVIILFLAMTGFKSPLSTAGFSALSLGSVNFNSNDATVGGQAWLLTVSQNGAGQYATGTFKLSDGQTTSDSFTLKLSLDQNYATYKIYSQGTYIKSVDWIKATYNPFSSTGGCNSAVWSNWFHPSSVSLLGDVYCYNFKNVGVYGTIGSANINFQSRINVDGSGGADSCTITNVGTTACYSNNGKVQASWTGSLVSGQSPPQPTDQNIIAAYDTSTGGWKTASGTAYDNYKGYSLLNCLSTQNDKSNCFNNYNTLSSNIMRGYPFISSGGDTATTSGSQTNGQVTLNLPKQVQFPVITMRIKADLIGINIPVGKPKIISLTSSDFQTGQTGIINALVQNVGNAQGSFDVSASCSSGFSQYGNSIRVSLQPGETQNVYLPISSNTVGDLQGTCSVKVNDVNNPTVSVMSSVGVSSSAIVICQEGDSRISGNQIQQCQSNVWKTIKTCSQGYVAQYKGGIPDCIPQEQAGLSFGDRLKNFFLHPLSSVKDLIKGTFSFAGDLTQKIRNVVTIIVGVFAFLFGLDFFRSFRILQNRRIIAAILSLGVALLISYIAYISFWIGVIAFAGWVIFRLVISGKLNAVRRVFKR